MGKDTPAGGFLRTCWHEFGHQAPCRHSSKPSQHLEQESARTHTRARNLQARARAPQPVDFWVPAGVSVVTLTGPNTGGKTASLKALGLAAAMSRAGLFLPLQPAAKGQCPAVSMCCIVLSCSSAWCRHANQPSGR